MSLKSQTWDHQLKVPPGELVLRIFTSRKKIYRPQPGLNPRTLDLKASTLSRDHQGPLFTTIKRKVKNLKSKKKLNKSKIRGKKIKKLGVEGLNPRTLDLEASTLPRDHRGRLFTTIKRKVKKS